MGLLELLDNDRAKNYAEKALKTVSGKKNIILFGAAEYGKIICDYFLANGVYPLCYCDNSIEKIGKKWNGLDIIAPDKIDRNDFVVITCNAFGEITNQLTGLGLPKDNILFFDVKWLTYPNGKRKFITEHITDFENVYNQLSDEKSKKVFLNLLNYKLTYKPEYICAVADKRQYFDSELIKLPQNSYFIDAGSYTGDTLKEFVKYTGGGYEKAICMEPVKANVEILKSTIGENHYDNVDIFEIGASDGEKTLYFDSKSGMSARPSDMGDVQVQCDSIDNICRKNGYERIDFIKMDIEGSEYDALMGAENMIKKCHPLLAICVYHKDDDFYMIPNLIKKIYPGYRIFFRHYELSDEETVCYAIPGK